MTLNGHIKSRPVTVNQGRVLSIQSHVAYGYVGGKAAVFPLQCLGYDVDVVNTVNFSNHSGYGRLGGTRANAAELTDIFHGMEENGLLISERLLTGYIPGAEALSAVAVLATKLRQRDPSMIYVLDPVLGDSGKLYVAPDVIPVYQSMLPLATVITPNWFEVEVLTQTELRDLVSLRLALRTLHQKYSVPNVVISSMPLRPWVSEALPSPLQPSSVSDSESTFLICISSSLQSETSSEISKVHARCVPCIPGYFSGVGDLFSALLLAHFKPANPSRPPQTPLSYATSMALAKTHSVLSMTHEYAASLPVDDRLPTDEERDAVEPNRKIRRMKGRELRLIQSQEIIRGTEIDDSRQMQPWTGFWDYDR